jgi:bacillithiol synthase
MQHPDCPPATSKPKLRFESVDFAHIPNQSKLFLRYQADPLSLRRYYPNTVASHVEVTSQVGPVLAAYEVDRDLLCDALTEQNRAFGAGAKTFDNIELLRRKDTVAILTGQQAGLFTGPLYTVYKALSAIKMTECLRNRGIRAVPVFWAATEDHDFDEISRATFLGSGGETVDVALEPDAGQAGRAVGSVSITDAFARSIGEAAERTPDSEFHDTVFKELSEIWKPGRTIGQAFCSNLEALFADRGLIVVDPLDPNLKRLAAPVYSKAADRVSHIVQALVDRSAELEADGFHAQVLITPDYYPLFFHTDDGVRRSLRRQTSGSYRVVETKFQFTADELAGRTTTEPERFSPGVMLRPVVQDYLFPTLCYFGGGAEIAYFAQNSEVYRILDRPVTPVLHRQSFTVVEAKHARTLEKYELEFTDLLGGFEKMLPAIVEKFVNPSTSRLFADAEEEINLELNRLGQDLSRIDPTLAENLATRRRKILYHIAALQKKFHRVQIERDDVANRQLKALLAAVMPNGELQERKLNVGSFLVRYGPYFIDWVYDALELDERGHRVLYL